MSRTALEREAVELYGVADDLTQATWILRDGTILGYQEQDADGDFRDFAEDDRGHDLVEAFMGAGNFAMERFMRETGARARVRPL